MWWRKKKVISSNSDREHLISQDKDNLAFIQMNWPPQNKFLLSVNIANDWRIFLDRVQSIEAFIQLPRTDQMEHLQRYLIFAANQKQEADRLRQQNSDKSFECLCAHFSSRFIGSYLICLIENDRQWEKVIAPKLDDFLSKGWAMSFGLLPLPSDATRFPIQDPSIPHTYFSRGKY